MDSPQLPDLVVLAFVTAKTHGLANRSGPLMELINLVPEHQRGEAFARALAVEDEISGLVDNLQRVVTESYVLGFNNGRAAAFGDHEQLASAEIRQYH